MRGSRCDFDLAAGRLVGDIQSKADCDVRHSLTAFARLDRGVIGAEEQRREWDTRVSLRAYVENL